LLQGVKSEKEFQQLKEYLNTLKRNIKRQWNANESN
jgi:hypothetical protein